MRAAAYLAFPERGLACIQFCGLGRKAVSCFDLTAVSSVRYRPPCGAMHPPALGPRDILVVVRAAGLNPVDFKFRQGKLRAIQRPKLPFVMGNELAGEVIAVGSDIKRFRVGDRVFARVAKDRAGAFAEQACVDEVDAAHMPRNLDFTSAAAVPLAGLTALQALRTGWAKHSFAVCDRRMAVTRRCKGEFECAPT